MLLLHPMTLPAISKTTASDGNLKHETAKSGRVKATAESNFVDDANILVRSGYDHLATRRTRGGMSSGSAEKIDWTGLIDLRRCLLIFP